MGFRFQKRLSLVPGLRLNLSKSGASISLGARGARFTIGPKGTRRTVGIPGSGLSWTSYEPYTSRRHSQSSSPGNSFQPKVPDDVSVDNQLNGTVFESAAIEQLAAGSTSELAPVLDAARKRLRYGSMVLVATLAIIVFGALLSSPPTIVGAIMFGMIAWPGMALLDRRRLTVTLEYNLEELETRKFNELIGAFNELTRCERIWRIPVEIHQPDWKRHAGAAYEVKRLGVSLSLGLPRLLQSNLSFPTITLDGQTIYLAPDAILVVARNSVAALRYEDCQIKAYSTRFIEEEGAPNDTEVIGETWKFVNKKGGPDRRFSNNRRLPICRYGVIDLTSTSGLNERFQCSRAEAGERFASCVQAMAQTSQPATGSLEDHSGEETTDVASAFTNETSRARTLALEHGKLWEFLLVEELLKAKLQDLKKEWNNLDNEVQPISKKQLNSREFLSWLTGAMDELGSLGAKIGKCIKEELFASLGKPGVSGDAITVLKTVEGLFGYFRGFLTFERELHAADPPPKLKVFGVAFQGIAGSAIDIAEQLTNEWSQAVDRIQAGSHEFNIKVQFDLPQVHKAAAEMEKVQRNSQLYL